MIRSLLVTELRWDFDKIGKMEWKHVAELLNYWHKTPPLSQLLNYYFKAKGLRLISETEPTAFEKMIQDKSVVLKIDHVPTHLQGMLREMQEGKYARRK